MGITAGLFALQVLVSQPMHFDKQVLATDLKGGYQVVTCDVNGDGKLDVIALGSDMSDLVWFENPTWKRHVMAKDLPSMVNLACWTPAPGAIPTIAVAYGFSMYPEKSTGEVAVLTSGEDPRNPWTSRVIDRLPTSHRLRWADIGGNGNNYLINAPLADPKTTAPDYRGHVPLVYYRPGEWKRREIGNEEEGIVHGIFVNDWDHNGRQDILIGGFLGIHLYGYGPDGKWSRTEIAKGSPRPWPKSGTSDISVGHLGKEKFLATIEPWHGNEVVVYRERAENWEREVIDNTILDGHNIETADFDGDGQDEIVAGFRGKPYGVYLYHWNGKRWDREIVEQGEVSAAGCAVADLSGAGRKDIVCIGGATHNLVIYRPSTEAAR